MTIILTLGLMVSVILVVSLCIDPFLRTNRRTSEPIAPNNEAYEAAVTDLNRRINRHFHQHELAVNSADFQDNRRAISWQAVLGIVSVIVATSLVIVIGLAPYLSGLDDVDAFAEFSIEGIIDVEVIDGQGTELVALYSDGSLVTNMNNLLLEPSVETLRSTVISTSTGLLVTDRSLIINVDGMRNVGKTIPKSLVSPVISARASRSDRNYMVLVDSAGYVFASYDAGETWSKYDRSINGTVSDIAIGAVGSPLFIATAEQGVLTNNAGKWVGANGFVNGALPTAQINSIAYDFRSGDRYSDPSGNSFSGALYAALPNGVYKSVDGGISWFRLNLDIQARFVLLDYGKPAVLYVVDYEGMVFRSKDRGVSWAK